MPKVKNIWELEPFLIKKGNIVEWTLGLDIIEQVRFEALNDFLLYGIDHRYNNVYIHPLGRPRMKVNIKKLEKLGGIKIIFYGRVKPSQSDGGKMSET